MNDETTEETYGVGDRVRIDIPNETDPDHRYHGKNGEVIAEIPDSASSMTGNPRDDGIFRVELDVGGTVDVRSRDLRPPF